MVKHNLFETHITNFWHILCFIYSFTKEQLILHGSAFLEIFISAILTILLYEPFWSISIYSCHVRRLSDWYTLFHNPRPNYENILYCTQEAVYPM